MKSSSLNLILTFALAAFVFQSVGVQSADAQERMFGNGRFPVSYTHLTLPTKA